MLTPEDLQRAVDLLDERFGVDVLWLYGSEAQGRARPDSDVDLGALFRRRPTGLERFDAAVDLGNLLGRDVDLVDLDGVSPVLVRQVLKTGRLVADRDPKRRHALFSKTVSMYDDLKIQRREAEQALFERVARGRS
jgi:predicted nucleotidyltransferase